MSTAQRLPERENTDFEIMYSKDFMARWNIPTAKYRNFSHYEHAKSYLDSISHNVVLKASGLGTCFLYFILFVLFHGLPYCLTLTDFWKC